MGFFKKLFGKSDHQVQEQEDDLARYKSVPWMTDRRLKSIRTCIDAGYVVAPSLPTDLSRSLRPNREIAQRLSTIKALVLWLMVPQEALPDDRILSYVSRNGLEEFLTDQESGILKLARDDQEARNQIGWKFENAWPLAWYFGYSKPLIDGQMMSGDQMQEILQKFSCPLDVTVEDWIVGKDVRSQVELEELEDLFYCIHNAVRSAQVGGNTVPSNFDAVGNGGVIHERRHALTWMLSQGVSWENTDLST